MAATSPEILVDTHAVVRRGQIASLTGLRAFAALVVVVVHASSISAFPWVGLHNYGPIALFVLSGFLLFQPWSRWLLGATSRPDIGAFARRRMWRIFPPYLTVLLLASLLYPPSRPDDAASWVRNATLTHVYVPGDLGRGLFHTWSLGTELAWYFFLPILGVSLGWLTLRHRMRVTLTMAGFVGVAALVTILWRWAYFVNLDDPGLRLVMPMWLPALAVCFLGGAFCGHLAILSSLNNGRSRIGQWVARWQPLLLMLALAAGVLGASRLGGPWTFADTTLSEALTRFISMTFMALLLLIGAAFAAPGSLLARLFGNRAMVAVGRWSYGVYLWHMPVMLMLYERMGVPKGPGGLVLWIALIGTISIGLGAATYRFIERPSIAYSRRIMQTA
ncbi:MAG: acyltransferase [Actinomycetia bacterium]|nr:acyltransferase [Actinomycetes bacterium]